MDVKTATVWTDDHTPDNQKWGSCESAKCSIAVRDGANGEWLEVTLNETYRLRDGKRDVNRQISITLNAAQRAELLEKLTWSS